MEMNTTEKFYLPVDGITDTFSSHTAHRHTRMTLKGLQNASKSPEKSVAERRSLSSGNRHSSSDLLPRRSVDQLEMSLTKPRNCHRIVVLGAPKVGKTNILQRFLGRDFEEHYEPTTEDFHRKMFYIRGEAYQVDLLDAAKERDFPAKRRLSILTGDVFLLVFSLEDRESLNNVRQLMNEIEAAKTKLLKLKHMSRVPVVICGNKADLDSQRVVSRSEVRETLGKDAVFFETSAKDDTGLEGVFRTIATLGGLPEQTGPSKHQLVSILTYQSLCISHQRSRGGIRAARGPCAPCAALDPLARRPSFTSDLRLVLGSSTKTKPEKCQIQ
ncbi:GTP-binding protein Rhes [Genypterus blacodes]|uniref:GTP-binding protein Rhes n=1 Tax=Genypterus blacodes TaxID=154954 RepID=UPI003F77759D